MSLLEARQVTKIFGGLVAVDHVDFSIEEKSIASLIGPNGAGKTTFFNCLTGLYEPEIGEVIFDGKPLVGLRPDQITATGMARTYQNIRLFGGMTALENVLVGQHVRMKATPLGAIFRTRSQVAEERMAENKARELMAFVGLEGKGDMIAKNLPYGDQRLLEIARAMGSDPKLLLLGRTGRGHEPERDRRHDGPGPSSAGSDGDDRAADRARYESGYEHLGLCDRVGLWQEDRRGRTGHCAGQSTGHRSLFGTWGGRRNRLKIEN